MEKNTVLPNILLEKLKRQYSTELFDKILMGYNSKRVSSFRVNNLKSSKEEVLDILQKSGIEYNDVSKSENIANAIIFEDEKDILNKTTLVKDGKIYMQSLSSMLPVEVMDLQPKIDMLDMTAAPGGKTTQICSVMNNNINVVACENNHIRFERLKHNIELQGAKNVNLMNIDSTKLDDFYKFDLILLDAPCSGSGTINIKKPCNFSLNLLNSCIDKQKKLLCKALKILKKGGEIVYSTCSILCEENEDILTSVLPKYNAKIVPISTENFNFSTLPTKLHGTVLVCPDERYEGFFLAKIIKQ